jgi:uridine kinase
MGDMIGPLIDLILPRRQEVPDERAMLVGISGIDASGKGFIANLLSEQLESQGLSVAPVNVDAWLDLPSVRFDPNDLPGNFYRNGLRLNEMFDRLILPLRNQRSIKVEIDLAKEQAVEFCKHTYRFEGTDIIILEGIFLFKREYVDYFDQRIWIECSFEVALERALERSQEGLLPQETVSAYQAIYFPAQKLHFDTDRPRDAADFIFDNNWDKK